MENKTPKSINLIKIFKYPHLTTTLVWISAVISLFYLKNPLYIYMTILITFLLTVPFIFLDIAEIGINGSLFFKSAALILIMMSQAIDYDERQTIAHQQQIYNLLISKSDIHTELVPTYQNCQDRIHKKWKQGECFAELKIYADALELEKYGQVFKDLQSADWSNEDPNTLAPPKP